MNKLTFVFLSLFASTSFTAPNLREINEILKLVPSITPEELSKIVDFYQAAEEANKSDKIAFKVFSKDGNVCAKTNEKEQCFSHDRIRELIVQMVKNSDKKYREEVLLPNLSNSMAALLASSEGCSFEMNASEKDADRFDAAITTPSTTLTAKSMLNATENTGVIAVDLKSGIDHFGYRMEIDMQEDNPTSVNGFWKRTKSDGKA